MYNWNAGFKFIQQQIDVLIRRVIRFTYVSHLQILQYIPTTQEIISILGTFIEVILNCWHARRPNKMHSNDIYRMELDV